MANHKDILEILALISVAYPNFKMAQSGNASTADAYMALLGDLPADILKLATLKCCAENGRAFAPSVGEIRGAASDIQRAAQNIPTAIEAWDEVCNAPKPYPADYILIRGGEVVEHPVYQWSHPFVKKIAHQFGFPDFPNFDNLGLDRAHFFKQYELQLQGNLERTSELPEVTRYIESAQVKQLAKGMEIK